MIDALVVRDFQSIQHARLELGKFTVLVGPSSSGKTAVLRAARVLVGNSRGAAFVRQGAKHATIAAVVNRQTVVKLDRGAGLAKYEASPVGQEPVVWTKVGTGVPEDVSRLLGIQPDHQLHFAGQFDSPFLLNESGASVARVLGDLTNVRIIFDAAREGNRRKKSVSAELTTRKADLEQCRTQLQRFQDLPQRIAVQDVLEASVRTVRELEVRTNALERVVTNVRVATSALERLRQSVPSVPSTERFEELIARRDKLQDMAYKVRRAAEQCSSVQCALDAVVNRPAELEEELHDKLREAGTCPTCGKSYNPLTT